MKMLIESNTNKVTERSAKRGKRPVIAARLPVALYTAVVAQAKQGQVDTSVVVRRALAEYVHWTEAVIPPRKTIRQRPYRVVRAPAELDVEAVVLLRRIDRSVRALLVHKTFGISSAPPTFSEVDQMVRVCSEYIEHRLRSNKRSSCGKEMHNGA